MPGIPEWLFNDDAFAEEMDQYVREWEESRREGILGIEDFNIGLANMVRLYLRDPRAGSNNRPSFRSRGITSWQNAGTTRLGKHA